MTRTPEPGDGPYVPHATAKLLRQSRPADRHPGLQLDKFSAGGIQGSNQGPALDAVCQTQGAPHLLKDLHAQRRRMMDALGATRLRATTAGPLTLHLSRASALENAGICLHPVYGFVYLPASGLKGMARAYAETVWQREQADATAAQETIYDVFGRGPIDGGDSGASAGRVVFHDAWPETWPHLHKDIVNNHHRSYYQGEPPAPPEDWDDPVPVTFLAVGSGVTFEAALSPRRGDRDRELVALARDWLLAALCHRGAGAKTNAGYGHFTPAAEAAPAEPGTDRTFTTTLTLVTPGFFAGANQDKADCDLRPASLRGQLRWWWRTLYASRLSPAELRRREALIWGDTNRAGAIRIIVEPRTGGKVEAYNKKQASRELPPPPNKKMIQGLHYVTYGMDEKDIRRHYVTPGGSWPVRLIARPTGDDGPAPDAALREAEAALWLLSRYGAVGSKERKGFGNFADIQADRLTAASDCLALARSHAADPPSFGNKSPDLAEAVHADLLREWPVGNKESWNAIVDRAGSVLQKLAKEQQNQQHRIALGLPRKNFKAGLNRHAAPYFMHLGQRLDGTRVLRFIGFPAARLPDRKTSTAMLAALRDRLDAEFGGQSRPSSVGHTRRPDGQGGDRPKQKPAPRRAKVDEDDVTILQELPDGYRVQFPWGDIEVVGKDEVSFE